MSITLPRKAVWSPLIKMATVWYQWMPPFSLLSQPPYQPVLLSTFCHLDGNQGLSEPHHNHQHGDCQPSDLKISLLSSPIWPISPTIRSGCNLPNLSAFLTDLSACQASCTCSSCHPRSDLSSPLDFSPRIQIWVLNNLCPDFSSTSSAPPDSNQPWHSLVNLCCTACAVLEYDNEVDQGAHP